LSGELELYQDFFLKERNIKLEKQIKEGSGVSFQGFHETFKRKVFVKFVSLLDEVDVENEVDVLIKFRNKRNIVSVFDAFHDNATDSQLVITTEYIDGVSLDGICGLKNLSTKQALQIVMDVLCGVGELHGQGFVHRDLKLENVILKGNNPIIVDLGSVKPVNSNVTKDDPIPNLYKSPEVFLQNTYTYKSDLYQVGLILFQLINGNLPFETEFFAKDSKMPYDDENMSMVALNYIRKLVVRDKLTNIIECDPMYNSKIKKLVSNALKLRYSTADAFYNDICKVKGKIPDIKKESESVYSCENWNRSNYKIMIESDKYRLVKQGLRKRDIGVFNCPDELYEYFKTA
jgi:eukaryotic-like serine/threonine-protein kinase